MSVAKLKGMLGVEVLIPDGPVNYLAKIKDIKQSYGSVLYLIEPVSGSGSKWVKEFKYGPQGAED